MAMMKSSTGEIVDFSAMFRACDEWFGLEMAWLYGQLPQPRRGIVLGSALWGKAYIENFERYSLPSLLAPENRVALSGGALLLLYTSPEDHVDLVSRTKRLKAAGIEVQLRIVPQAVMAETATHWMAKYWLLGTAHNACIQLAGKLGMAFHMYQPDHVYARTYYANLLRLAGIHQAVLQNGISANLAGATGELEQFRRDGFIGIGDRDLCDIGFRHMHLQHKSLMMNGRNLTDKLPALSWLGWRGRNSLTIASPHMNPAYMAPGLCLDAPSRIPATIDAEAPALVPSGWYVAQANDGLGFIEVSTDNKPHYEADKTPDRFAYSVWNIMKFSDSYIPYYSKPCQLPLSYDPAGMDDDAIELQHRTILAELATRKGAAAIEFVQAMDGTHQ